MMRTSPLLAFLAVASVLCAAATPAAALGAEWKSIKNVTDPHIQELGAWAVAEHGKVANDRLRFRKVVDGKLLVLVGVTYLLDVDAVRLDGKDAVYKAKVYEQDTSRKLISFQPASN
ncbi:hypothetical protein BRADI_1g70480v3 [Brachypodium distachyon]|uniref:Cystatin domain-containing protein n=3 Tax=Brachypodium distachyon TaxID=15368 RepID=I1H8A3_BRADI|nr:hypothetical protein BRADI_1g70480v3 [Brachypodium distachyon]